MECRKGFQIVTLFLALFTSYASADLAACPLPASVVCKDGLWKVATIRNGIDSSWQAKSNPICSGTGPAESIVDISVASTFYADGSVMPRGKFSEAYRPTMHFGCLYQVGLAKSPESVIYIEKMDDRPVIFTYQSKWKYLPDKNIYQCTSHLAPLCSVLF